MWLNCEHGGTYLDLPTLIQHDSSGFLFTVYSSHKGLKMACGEVGCEGKALCKGKTGPAELGPPSQNQPWDLHADEHVTCPCTFRQLWLLSAGCPDVEAPELSMNPSEDFQTGTTNTKGNCNRKGDQRVGAEVIRF